LLGPLLLGGVLSCAALDRPIGYTPLGESARMLDLRKWQPGQEWGSAVDSFVSGYREAQVRSDGARARDLLQRGWSESDVVADLSGEGVEAKFLEARVLLLVNRLRCALPGEPTIWVVLL
jgi:hypothetical protein